MPTISIDPLTDPRYDEFVINHPDATVFHTSAWIRVLHETYGFKPGCVTTVENDKIHGLLPYMETRGITGKRRCVSLPFSDFCEPLFFNKSDFDEAFNALRNRAIVNKWRYIELRGGSKYLVDKQNFAKIFTHDILLERNENEMFGTLRSSLQRNIRKAQKSGLVISFETSLKTMKEFYRLNCLTRREHGLPPQPWMFFRRLLTDISTQNRGFIASVLAERKTVASAIFFIVNNRAYYKYGASERKFQNLRPNDFMMWNSMINCKELGCKTLNLGRTEPQHAGLLQFKHGWNGIESQISYFRFSPARGDFTNNPGKRKNSIYNRIFKRMPQFLLRWIGKILYRFAG